MVATRSGVRVCSPTKIDSDHTTDVQATPSTGRRTRRTAKQPESPTRQTVVGASSQLEKVAEGSPPPASARKRCSRAFRLHSPDKPCTPVGSVHEGDISDVDSCCSAVLDIDAPVTHRRTRRLLRTANQEDDVSEVESCSSAVSSSRVGVRRSARKKKIPEVSDSAAEVTDVKVEVVPKSEPCTPSVSATKSQRSKRTRTAARSQTEDSEISDADSVTGDVSKSTVRRSTRSSRQVQAIPFHLKETSGGSQSPAPTPRTTRATRGKAAPENVSEPPSCDSDGFESGPSYSRTTRSRRKTQAKVTESDSDLTDVGRGGTPSSSRTGSGSSARLASTMSPKTLSVVLEKAVVPFDQDASFNDSKLETTVIAEDKECTLLKEEENTESGEVKESGDVQSTETKQEVEEEAPEKPVTISDDLSSPVSDKAAGADEPAVITEAQQEEPSAESKVDINSEMEMMQETVQSSEPLKPPQSASVTTCDSEITENRDEAMEVANVDTDVSDNKKPLDQEDDVEMPEGDKMEDSSGSGEAQQVVDSIKGSPSETEQCEEEPILATSSQESTITVEQPSEQPRDSAIQSKTIISLLDSSEDEEDYDEYAEDGGDSSADEEEGDLETESEEPKKMEVAKSIEGLFMIDTRPGQEADEHYYKDGTREEDEATQKEAAQEEEFVDEEGDDDDDEEADSLFSSRNPQSKELSSRIDPGIRMKELGGLYISFDGSKSKPVSSSQQKLKEKKIQEEVMKKSVIGPDFEKKDAVPPYNESKHALKLKRRTERQKTTGDAWFNMKAPEITPELKGDLQLLRMRGSMDSKRFYKKNDREGFPKYFQMGTVVDSPVDFYHSRIPKKDRKRTMVEELLADAEFRHKNKKKFQTIMAEKAAQGAGRRRKMKNKFHKK